MRLTCLRRSEDIGMALVHGSLKRWISVFDGSRYTVALLQQADFGRAHPNIRLRTAQPMATSVFCAANERARSRRPMIDL